MTTSFQSQFFEVLSDIKLFCNGSNILEKVQADGNFQLLSTTFTNIIKHEILYAVCGTLTRAEENERKALFLRYNHSSGNKFADIQGKLETHNIVARLTKQSK